MRGRRRRNGSPIQLADQVDLVTEAPDGTFVLIMVETRPWDGSEERLFELQEKVNGYLAFVGSGQMEAEYPGSVGRPKRFQLDCEETPDEVTSKFLERVRETLAAEGIELRVHVLPPE
jgi:hypothetical protein